MTGKFLKISSLLFILSSSVAAQSPAVTISGKYEASVANRQNETKIKETLDK